MGQLSEYVGEFSYPGQFFGRVVNGSVVYETKTAALLSRKNRSESWGTMTVSARSIQRLPYSYVLYEIAPNPLTTS